MSINFKPINEVPEVESLSEGDKLLVNSNGAAKQIDASKVGGSGGGGGGMFYAVPQEAEGVYMLTIHADKALTKPMTFAEGMAVLESGPVAICLIAEEGSAFLYPLFMSPVAEGNACVGYAYVMGEFMQLALVFSDSVLE